MELGKYAAFIWGAYGVTAAVFAGLIWASLNHARKWRKRTEELTGK